jgi:hypothetical protein
MDRPTTDNSLDAFKPGDRVQLHPDTNTAVGDRWGEVVIIGDKYVHVLAASVATEPN